MMRNPVVSVIVPIYNVENYLDRCVNSVLKQTFHDFELLLVDDGSTDRSGVICDEYTDADGRIKVIHKDNAGVSAARNTGVDLAAGKYITFVDSDDWIDEDFLEAAVAKCEDMNLDIFMGGIARVDNDKRIRFGTIESPIFSAHILSEEEYVSLLENCYTSSCCSNLYRRSFIADVRFDNDSIWGEDLCFLHKLLQRNPIIFATPHIYYNYRLTDGSATTQVSKKKTACVRKTYLTLLEFAAQLKFKESGCFRNYIDKRLMEDYLALYKMILCSEYTIMQKYLCLHELLSDKRIKDRLKQQQQEKFFRRYGYNPYFILFYQCIKKL